MAATKTNKPRIHSVAKELGVNNKELMALLEQYGQGVKNHMSALTEEDMNIIFDYYTQKFDDGSDIGEFLKQEEYEPCPMADTLKKLSALTGIEIPEEEFVEAPAVGIPTTAQIVDANVQQ